MSLNVDKTHYILFTTHKKNPPKDKSIITNGFKINEDEKLT